MQNLTSVTELKNVIQLLKVEQAVNGKILREQFQVVYVSLKPANLLKSTLGELVSAPFIIDNIINSVIGFGTAYITKKIVTGLSGNIIRNIIGSVLQLGVTNIVSKHPDAIISVGKSIFQHFFSTKRKSKTNDE